MASVLPVIELTKLGNQIYAKTYHPFEIYISLGVLYFVMTYSMTFVARKLERKATLLPSSVPADPERVPWCAASPAWRNRTPDRFC